MKEKMFEKGNRKILFGVVLAFAMMLFLMPINRMTVYADPKPIKDGSEIKYELDDRTLTISGDGDMPGDMQKTDYPWDSSRGSITSVIIESGVRSIGYYAFEDCEALESVVISDSVTSIGNNAFCDCASLERIQIPNSVETISVGAFQGCTALKDVTIPNGVTSIGNSAFQGCTSLESVTIADSVESMGNAVFSGCSDLKSVTIPNKVTSIGMSTFASCISLESVTIPDSVTSIGDYAFNGCTGMTSVTIPESVTSIGNYAFSGCTGMTSVTFEGIVGNIGESAFKNVGIEGEDKTTLKLPSGMTGPESNSERWYGGYFKVGKETPSPTPSPEPSPDPSPTPDPSDDNDDNDDKNDRKEPKPQRDPNEVRGEQEETFSFAPVSTDGYTYSAESMTEIPTSSYNLSRVYTTRGIIKGLQVAIDGAMANNRDNVEVFSSLPLCFTNSVIQTIRSGGKPVVFYFVHKDYLYSVTVPANFDTALLYDANGFAGPLYVGQQLGTTKLIKQISVK